MATTERPVQPTRTDSEARDGLGFQIQLEDHSADGSPQPEPAHKSNKLNRIQTAASTLGRRWSLREGRKQLKYAKWRPNRASAEALSGTESLQNEDVISPVRKSAGSRGTYEVDILYENQRGSFFFGVPLFSQKSLLNLDPAPWVNAAFKDSPVDIITAQLPDPSWRWAWNSWYVDMSDDVDEEGWSYSFSFSPTFAWHGTHIWYSSFVRRRRWLRKRVHATDEDDMQLALSKHFEVESKNAQEQDDIERLPPNEKLLTRLKSARLDREKLQILDQFLRSTKLSDDFAPMIPEVMGTLFFDASRRRFVAQLKQLRPDKDEGDNSDRQSQSDSVLNKLIETAEKQVKQSEFWSDSHGRVDVDSSADSDTALEIAPPQDTKGKGKEKL